MGNNDGQEEVSWCEENILKLIILAIGCGATLAMVLIKQTQRQRTLQMKKSTCCRINYQNYY